MATDLSIGTKVACLAIGVVSAGMSCTAAVPTPGTPGAVQAGAAVTGQPFELKIGERVTVKTDGTTLTVDFDRVTEDSRCPIGVTCVWAGDAVVRLAASDASSRSVMSLHTQADSAREGEHGQFRVRLEGLRPEPRADASIDASQYVATIVVDVKR